MNADDLNFSDAVAIATGCTDYGGGYRYDAKIFEIYQAGIKTVIGALVGAQARGLEDTQIAVLHRIGGGSKPVRAHLEEPCNGRCYIELACRQVGPDGDVPGDARECAELWEREASRLLGELERFKAIVRLQANQ